MFCPWGSTVHSVIELLFPHMIVWCPGKNREGSIAAEEEGVPKVNIQTLLGLIPGSGHFLDLRRPEWNQEKGLTSFQGGGSDRQQGQPFLCVYLPLFQTVCLWSPGGAFLLL